ncbi:uncharacterized protein LOC110460249 [Mizuhopecten yessoensis]|uniref:Uncharacterized protein n=1 Tax=Mizuhopecten yessoensis TaxID=6573 RepID=A0A210Q2Y6_MIZYE|nr:uncharacterized protein LOC110460249 [Mizuhopecten yessoensis]OWF43075.1 hypothetical protein KP79_PYT21589 [Mizuhopecten yessoensis]
MVRETKTLGEGIPATADPTKLPNVKNIANHDSTRQITDLELADIVEKVACQSNSHLFYHKMQTLLGRDVANTLDTKGNRLEQPRSKTFYHMIMTYRGRKQFGLLEVGEVVKMLHSINMSKIAEKIEP